MSDRRVYVAGGYRTTGGAYMAYQVGRVLHERFALPVTVVGPDISEDSFFQYAVRFPVLSPDMLPGVIREHDILVATGGFARYWLGLQLKCLKICYVQSVSSYSVLDGFYDVYAFSARFVQDYALKHFNVSGPVINPSINTKLFDGGIDWDDRDNSFMALSYKQETLILMKRLKELYAEQYPGEEFPVTLYGKLNQQQLAETMGRHKYYISLSPLEGFGLPLLEAMASGCAVTGFHACGGLEYSDKGKDSLLSDYPDLANVAHSIKELMTNPGLARALAKAAHSRSRYFSQSRFDDEWVECLKGYI